LPAGQTGLAWLLGLITKEAQAGHNPACDNYLKRQKLGTMLAKITAPGGLFFPSGFSSVRLKIKQHQLVICG